jgi:hypothetical protein
VTIVTAIVVAALLSSLASNLAKGAGEDAPLVVAVSAIV